MVDLAGLGGRRMTSSALPQSKAPPSGWSSHFRRRTTTPWRSRLYASWSLCPIRDLLLCAKHLFVAARTAWVRQEAAALPDFDQAHVRFGASATRRYANRDRATAASPPNPAKRPTSR